MSWVCAWAFLTLDVYISVLHQLKRGKEKKTHINSANERVSERINGRKYGATG